MEGNQKRNRKKNIRITLWITFAIFLIATFIRGIAVDNFMLDETFNLIATVPVILLSYFSLSSKKFYNYPIILLVVYYISFIVNLAAHTRLDSLIKFSRSLFSNNIIIVSDILIVICFVPLFVFLLVFSVRYFILFPNNGYIKWFGFLTAIMINLAIINIGSFGNMMPLYVNYFFLLVLIATSLALLFLLPGIDISSWTSYERIVFYRMIMAPFVILLAANILYFVFPNF